MTDSWENKNILSVSTCLYPECPPQLSPGNPRTSAVITLLYDMAILASAQLPELMQEKKKKQTTRVSVHWPGSVPALLLQLTVHFLYIAFHRPDNAITCGRWLSFYYSAHSCPSVSPFPAPWGSAQS